MMSLRQTTTNAPAALRRALAVGGASGVAVPALCAVSLRGSLTASSGQRTAAFDDFHYACALSDGLAPRLAADDGSNNERGTGTDSLRHAMRHPPNGLRPFADRKDWTPLYGGWRSSSCPGPDRGIHCGQRPTE
jgi:hypothetical protein